MWRQVRDFAVGYMKKRRLEEEKSIWREVFGCEEAEAFGLCCGDVEEGGSKGELSAWWDMGLVNLWWWW